MTLNQPDRFAHDRHEIDVMPEAPCNTERCWDNASHLYRHGTCRALLCGHCTAAILAVKAAHRVVNCHICGAVRVPTKRITLDAI